MRSALINFLPTDVVRRCETGAADMADAR
jgi:hypothetical protein